MFNTLDIVKCLHQHIRTNVLKYPENISSDFFSFSINMKLNCSKKRFVRFLNGSKYFFLISSKDDIQRKWLMETTWTQKCWRDQRQDQPINQFKMDNIIDGWTCSVEVCFYLSICLSIISLCIYHINFSLSLSLSLSLCLILSLSLSLYLFVSFSLSLYLFVSFSLSL